MKVISYAATHKVSAYDSIVSSSPLNREGVGFDITRYIDTVDSKNLFVDCPVWSHKAKRSFLVKSPIDIEFSFTRDENNFYVNSLNDNLNINNLLLLGHTKDKNWIGDGNPTLQITVPTYVFWTKHKNIWIEVRPHPETAVKNNYISVGGWWNLSNWTRPTSFGIQVVDPDKKIKINRGDVIYQVCFYSDNMNDDFKLIKEKEIPENIVKKISQNVNLKDFLPNFSSKFLFAKQEKSKCPFSFLFNK